MSTHSWTPLNCPRSDSSRLSQVQNGEDASAWREFELPLDLRASRHNNDTDQSPDCLSLPIRHDECCADVESKVYSSSAALRPIRSPSENHSFFRDKERFKIILKWMKFYSWCPKMERQVDKEHRNELKVRLKLRPGELAQPLGSMIITKYKSLKKSGLVSGDIHNPPVKYHKDTDRWLEQSWDGIILNLDRSISPPASETVPKRTAPAPLTKHAKRSKPNPISEVHEAATSGIVSPIRRRVGRSSRPDSSDLRDSPVIETRQYTGDSRDAQFRPRNLTLNLIGSHRNDSGLGQESSPTTNANRPVIPVAVMIATSSPTPILGTPGPDIDTIISALANDCPLPAPVAVSDMQNATSTNSIVKTEAPTYEGEIFRCPIPNNDPPRPLTELESVRESEKECYEECQRLKQLIEASVTAHKMLVRKRMELVAEMKSLFEASITAADRKLFNVKKTELAQLEREIASGKISYAELKGSHAEKGAKLKQFQDAIDKAMEKERENKFRAQNGPFLDSLPDEADCMLEEEPVPEYCLKHIEITDDEEDD